SIPLTSSSEINAGDHGVRRKRVVMRLTALLIGLFVFSQRLFQLSDASTVALLNAGALRTTTTAEYHKRVLLFIELLALFFREPQKQTTIHECELLIEPTQQRIMANHSLIGVTGVTAVEALSSQLPGSAGGDQ